MQVKICRRCKKEKVVSEFPPNKKMRDGFGSWCRLCKKEWRRQYHLRHYNKEERSSHYFANKDKEAEINKRWRERNREKISLYSKEYKAAHREEVRERQRRYNSENRARINANAKSWRERNKDKHQIHKQNRRALTRGGRGRVFLQEWKTLCGKYGNKCLCCGRSDVELTQDHIIPVSKGGAHTIDNIQPLCLGCNSKKHTKIIDYRNGLIFTGA